MTPLALLVVSVFAQTLAFANTPIISFAKINHDFGKIDGGHKVNHCFAVTNTGNAPLQIKQVVPACGCTFSVPGKRILIPGESTEINVSFDPKGFLGKVHKSVEVISDARVNPTVTLTFDANVIYDIIPSTTSLLFSRVSRNVPRKAVVRLMSGNGQPVQITQLLNPTVPHIHAVWHLEGSDAVIDVTFNGRNVPPRQMSGLDTLTLHTTSSGSPRVPVDIQWELLPTISVVPDRLVWIEPVGRSLSATLLLSHLSNKAFRVIKIQASSQDLAVQSLNPLSRSNHDLRVTFSSPKAGVYCETLTFFTDDPEQPEIQVGVYAVIR